MLDKNRSGSENCPNLRGKRILVLEDDPIIAVEWYFQLKRLGARQVFEATNHFCWSTLSGTTSKRQLLTTARHIPFIIISGDTFGKVLVRERYWYLSIPKRCSRRVRRAPRLGHCTSVPLLESSHQQSLSIRAPLSERCHSCG